MHCMPLFRRCCLVALLVLGLGVAKEKRVVAPMPEGGATAYWRDTEGVHYVPKRSLEDLIIARF